jgi:hypothetical protein
VDVVAILTGRPSLAAVGIYAMFLAGLACLVVE